MLDLFNGSALQLSLIAAGVAILGFALLYGALRSGRMRGPERGHLESNTKRAQTKEDPQK